MAKSTSVVLWAAVGFGCLLRVAQAEEATISGLDESSVPIMADGGSERALEARRTDVVTQTTQLRRARETKDLVAKAGQWSSRRFNTDARSWQVQLERDRNTGHIGGTIRANGSYLLAGAAKVDGQLTGSSVSGVVVDAAGKQLATFTGTASAQGMSGTYVTSDGDDGEWSYADPEPVPEAVSETSELMAEPVR